MHKKLIKKISDIATLGGFRVFRGLAQKVKKGVRSVRISSLPPSDRIAVIKVWRGGQLTFLTSLLIQGEPRGKKGLFYPDNEYWLSRHLLEANDGGDIKDAWFRGRCHEAVYWAWAYKQTGDERSGAAALGLIKNFLTHNPPYNGVHWVGPMEVAIRAVNWIVALDLLGDYVRAQGGGTFDEIVQNLYAHLHYLEHTWEIYDGRTNNHYLSNLVGYLYLCWFFRALPSMKAKWTWCITEIQREWDWQILPDGTSYEGSTEYHGLVMELLFFAKELARMRGTPFDATYDESLNRMAVFYSRCTIGNDRLCVGDNGSDFLMPLIVRRLIAGDRVLSDDRITYPDFGMTFLKNRDFNVTVRHPNAHTARQPSAHFHNDDNSITITYKNIPLIVDPGSYVYTGDPVWRNHFRSISVHNTFFIEGQESRDLSAGLFVAPWNGFYDQIVPYRVVHMTDEKIIVTDSWEIRRTGAYMSCWNFTVAPGIDVRHVDGDWVFMREGIPLMRMRSPLPFERYDTWVSRDYGHKERSYGLRARTPLSTAIYTIYFSAL